MYLQKGEPRSRKERLLFCGSPNKYGTSNFTFHRLFVLKQRKHRALPKNEVAGDKLVVGGNRAPEVSAAFLFMHLELNVMVFCC